MNFEEKKIILNKIEEAIQIKDKDGLPTIDYLQLKDNEIISNKDYSDINIIKKSKKDNSNPDKQIDIYSQIDNIINNLIKSGDIQIINSVGIKFNSQINDGIISQAFGEKITPFHYTVTTSAESVGGYKVGINPGTWSNENLFKFFGIRPCILNNKGEVTRYLDPNNYNRYCYPENQNTWYTDLDISQRVAGENVMIEIPKIYMKYEYKIENGKEVVYFRLSNGKSININDGWKVHPAFYSEATGGKTYADKIYIAAFQSSLATTDTGETQLCSRACLSPETEYSLLTEYAHNIGNGFEILTWSKFSLLYELYMIMSFKYGMESNFLIHYGSSGVSNVTWGINKGLMAGQMVKDGNGDYFPQFKWLGITDPFSGRIVINGMNAFFNLTGERFSFKYALHGPYVYDSANDIGKTYYTHYKNPTYEGMYNNPSDTYRIAINNIKIIDGIIMFIADENATYSDTDIYDDKIVQYTIDTEVPTLYTSFGANVMFSNGTLRYLSDKNRSGKTLITYS